MSSTSCRRIVAYEKIPTVLFRNKWANVWALGVVMICANGATISVVKHLEMSALSDIVNVCWDIYMYNHNVRVQLKDMQ
jgi:hypothetical protein